MGERENRYSEASVNVVWALYLLVVALGSHAVLIAWLRRGFGMGRDATIGLSLVGIVLSLALFAPRSYFAFTSTELMFVAMGASGFVAFFLARSVVRWARARWFDSSPRDPVRAPIRALDMPLPSQSRRDVLLGAAGAVSWAGSGLALGWGVVRGRHDFELVETEIRIPGLPRVLDGYVIAQVSDLHVGAFIDEQELLRGLSLVRDARPDLLVATGDLVDLDPSFTPLVAKHLRQIAPRDGVVAILGNHDYYGDAVAVRAALRGGGVEVLVDEARMIRPNDGGGFRLIGLDDLAARAYGGRGPHLAQALELWPSDASGRPANRDRPTILLAHQPKQFDQTAGKVALQLSGHTHGMQFDFAARVGRMAHAYVAGRYEKDGSTLWVNRGFGVTGPPSRIGVRPEVTKIVLVSA